MTKNATVRRKLPLLRIVCLLALLSAGGFGLYRFSPHSAASVPVVARARWGADKTIAAAKRGSPWINVMDGQEVLTDFAGAPALQTAFADNRSRPLSSVALDFDEDGMPDLVSGYVHDGGGAASFLRGNVDAVYPNTPEAKARQADGTFTETPFLGPARLFALPVVPDFLAAGDFDADGHCDLVAAGRTDNALYFLRGDGRGNFAFAHRTELPGRVTALLADDFNRRDGLNDILAGVQTKTGGQLLVFEHPYGAMQAQPETFDFAAPVTSLATGPLDSYGGYDLAIAAGHELAVLTGRDRQLTRDASSQAADAPRLTRQVCAFDIQALTIGDFIAEAAGRLEIAALAGDGQVHLLANGGATDANGHLLARWRDSKTLALPSEASAGGRPVMLTTRVSARSIDTLTIGLGRRIYLLTSDVTPPRRQDEKINYAAHRVGLEATLDVAGATAAILPMRLNIDALSDLVVLREDAVAPAIVPTAPVAGFMVDTTNTASDCNLNDGICSIPPMIGGVCMGGCGLVAAFEQVAALPGASAIMFATSGPFVGGPVNPYFTPNPLTLDGTFAGRAAIVNREIVLGLSTGSDSNVVRGLVINSTVATGSNSYLLFPSTSNTIVEDNRFGTDSSGTSIVSAAARQGVVLNSRNGNNRIGGPLVAARNLVAGGGLSGRGVGISKTADGADMVNVIQNNYIGTDVTGTLDFGNSVGISVLNTTITIGGVMPGVGNLISGNAGQGLLIDTTLFNASDYLVQGNRIGLNAAGTTALGNDVQGVSCNLVSGGPTATVGGAMAGARNVISGNGGNGVQTVNRVNVIGNYIGTNAAGDLPRPNGQWGLNMTGTLAKEVSNNVISGNVLGGAVFNNGGNPVTNDLVADNFIGTDATGNQRVGNSGPGLRVDSTTGATGTFLVRGNTIAANASHGIFCFGCGGVRYELNLIGTNANLFQTLNNGGDGFSGSVTGGNNQLLSNTIAFNTGHGITFNAAGGGSQNSILSNKIMGNGGDGVSLIATTRNPIRNNQILNNGGLGIDLNDNGVTNNDDCDADFGANMGQNFPVLTSVNAANGNLSIAGTLNSTAGTQFMVDFYISPSCDASGNGEGQTYLGSANVTTNASCTAALSASFPFASTGTQSVTATATDPNGNTSEFSACQSVAFPTPTPTPTPTPPSFQFLAPEFSALESNGLATITVTRTGNLNTAAAVSFSTTTQPADFTRPCFEFNGQASPRCDYATANGTLNFAAGVQQLTFPVLLNDDGYAEGNEVLRLALSNPTNGATLGAPNISTLTINDDETANIAANQFIARLRDNEVVPPVSSAATGTATGALTGANFSLNLSFSGLSSAQTSAHIHGPAPFNDTTAAPVIATLPNGAVTNFALNNLTAAQSDQLKGGLWYVDIHTANNPNGEIKGSLLGNPLEDPRFFVAQQFKDFLGRAPQGDFWINEITRPGGVFVRDPATLAQQRLFVTDNFFLSAEFQRGAAYVFRLYRAAYGDNQPFPNERPDNDSDPFCVQHGCPVRRLHLLGYSKFAEDFGPLLTRATTAGQPTAQGSQALAQYELAEAFVQRAEFLARYPLTQTGPQFVDAVLATIQSVGTTLPAGERDKLVTHFTNGGRALVLFHIANDYWNGCAGAAPCVPPGPTAGGPPGGSYGAAVDVRPFIDGEYRRVFVATQFYGYFRRDADLPGYNFWFQEVGMAPVRNQPIQRYMECNQINSNEYQERFGFGLTRAANGVECPFPIP